MTTPECQKSILDDVLAPHLASEDGQTFLVGQARLERVQVYCAPVNLPNPFVLQLELYSLTSSPNGRLLPLLLPFAPHALKYKAQNLREAKAPKSFLTQTLTTCTP